MTDAIPRFKYQSLAAEIESKIAAGIYRPGEKLPSIRMLNQRLNMSMATISQAFVYLENEGVIEARPKSGYYVRPRDLHHRQIPVMRQPSRYPHRVVLDSIAKAYEASFSNADLLPLGAALIASELLPTKALSAIIKTLSTAELQNILSYATLDGDLRLRRKIAAQANGIVDSLTPDDIVITNGCTEAIAVALKAVVQPGDTIAVESPTFYGIHPLLASMDIRVVEVPTDPGWGVRLDRLEQIIARGGIKACLFTPNFHNPLGSLMSDETKARLVALVTRHGIPLIEDDALAELYFGKQRPASLKQFDRQGLVLTCSSFSKSMASGLRIGWVISGPTFRDKILAVKAGMSAGTASLDQYLFAQFLGTGKCERHMRRLRAALEKQVLKTVQAVRRYFPAGTDLQVPRGGFVLWVQLPASVDSLDLYRRALERQIFILPGPAFSAAGRYPPPYSYQLRLSVHSRNGAGSGDLG